MLDVEKWQKFGAFVAAHWLAFIVGIAAGATLTALLYEKFIIAGLQNELVSVRRADPQQARDTNVKDTPQHNNKATSAPINTLLASAVFVRVERKHPDGITQAWHGSGVSITPSGRVITAAVLFTPIPGGDAQPVITVGFDRDGVTVSRPAILLKISDTLGLALLQVTGTVGGANADVSSAALTLGEEVTIVGFSVENDKSLIRSTVSRVTPLRIGIQGSVAPNLIGAPIFGRGEGVAAIVVEAFHEETYAAPADVIREFARL